MAITTINGYLGGTRIVLPYTKVNARTTVANAPASLRDIAGQPGAAASLAVGNTTNGVIFTDATAGFHILPSFGSANGYISRVECSCNVASQWILFDCVWSAGAFNANTNGTSTLTSPPIVNRQGAGFEGLELWYESASSVTGLQTLRVNYVDETGSAANTGNWLSGVQAVVGRMFRVPLTTKGIQCVNSVVGTISTAGTFNLHIMRRLWTGRANIANDVYPDVSLFQTGMPLIYDTSALFFVEVADSTASGLCEHRIEIVYG